MICSSGIFLKSFRLFVRRVREWTIAVAAIIASPSLSFLCFLRRSIAFRVTSLSSGRIDARLINSSIRGILSGVSWYVNASISTATEMIKSVLTTSVTNSFPLPGSLSANKCEMTLVSIKYFCACQIAHPLLL